MEDSIAKPEDYLKIVTSKYSPKAPGIGLSGEDSAVYYSYMRFMSTFNRSLIRFSSTVRLSLLCQASTELILHLERSPNDLLGQMLVWI